MGKQCSGRGSCEQLERRLGDCNPLRWRRSLLSGSGSRECIVDGPIAMIRVGRARQPLVVVY